jgi:uncharacterized protein YbcC (UPF0753/DUF2309 family)
MRLLTVIEAPLTLVQDLLARLFKPRQLVQNGWIRLLVLDPRSQSAHRFERGAWLSEPVRLPD